MGWLGEGRDIFLTTMQIGVGPHEGFVSKMSEGDP